MASYLRENLTFKQAEIVVETANEGKELFMKGICIQGDVQNANKRVYPVNEINNAVKQITEKLKNGESVLGEVDHPDDLQINLDRVSHTIENMWMEGANGCGKLKIIPTPMGKLVQTMLESGVKLGVSSRGSGNVNESDGRVSEFEIITVDVVAQPSAPNAYPTAIYEGLLNMNGGQALLNIAKEAGEDQKVQKYLREGVIRLIKDLKLQDKQGEQYMFDALKPLLESDLVNEETRQAIQEAWESKVEEIKEQSKAELREEFAQKYQHDKSVMVEALDNMVTESLQDELKQIVKEKQALAEDRVKFNKKMTEAAKKFDTFMVSKLAEEIKELRSDRKVQAEALAKFEDFMVQALAEEIEEFQADKKDLAETKVKLVTEAKAKIADLQKAFVKKSAKLVENAVTKNLTKEITQLKEDIDSSRKNDFGRRIFEAFASEFGASHLNTNVEIKKLEKELQTQKAVVAETKQAAAKAIRLVESKDRELAGVKDNIKRTKVMQELLQPLNREKANAMRELLESVETGKLQTAFDKYLPALLNETKKPTAEKKMVTESRSEKTGDKKPTKPEAEVVELSDIRKLAGI